MYISSIVVDEAEVEQNAVRQMVDDLTWNEIDEPVKLGIVSFCYYSD